MYARYILALAVVVAVLALVATTSHKVMAQPCAAEAEPNDRAGEAMNLGESRCSTGTMSAEDRTDFVRVSVDETMSQSLVDISATPEGSTGDAILRITLHDADGNELQRRQDPATLTDLSLPVGDYLFSVYNMSAEETGYRFELVETGLRTPEMEAEPNDEWRLAVPINDQGENSGIVVGRHVGPDHDYYRFETQDDPQVWRIQAVGDGLQELALLNAGGEIVQSQRAADRLVRLDELPSAGSSLGDAPWCWRRLQSTRCASRAACAGSGSSGSSISTDQRR